MRHATMWLRGIFATFLLKAKKPKNPSYVEEPTTVGDHIRNVRLTRNLLQKDVAEILRVCEDTITGWERRRKQPQLKHLPAIIRFLRYIPDNCIDIPQLKCEIFLKRVKLGLSQRAMSKRIGIDSTTLHQIEINGRQPIKRTRNKLFLV